jgi:hypothetical protein
MIQIGSEAAKTVVRVRGRDELLEIHKVIELEGSGLRQCRDEEEVFAGMQERRLRGKTGRSGLGVDGFD